MTQTLDALDAALAGIGPMAIAVSGGVDSLTLALAASNLRREFVVFHAVSPAVPLKATERVRAYAAARDWTLNEIVAGEFGDPNYVANPYNRCYYCKLNLYGEIRKHTRSTIVSGTNLDDLSDYRPGLLAAGEAGVRHPFVDAGLGKREVRALASSLGEDGLAVLPASPCLSSRIETGSAIRADVLAAVDRIEEWIAARHPATAVRCRVRRNAVTVELDVACLDALSGSQKQAIVERTKAELPPGFAPAPVELAPYRMGSAFVAPRSNS